MIKKSTAKKILKEAGAYRISDDALDEFLDVINKYSYSLAQKAVKLAHHANRKTLRKEDIELAIT